MKNREKTVEKRTQQDYTMAFKLGVVSRVEKGDSLTNRHNNITVSKEEAPFWFGSENMVI
jgi:hypothetical protein